MEVAGELSERAEDLEREAVRKAEGAIDDALTDAIGSGGADAAKQGLRSLLGYAEEVVRAGERVR